MGIDLYEPFTNPRTRETFRCISFSEEAYRMEWIVQPRGYVPFEHVHANQEEIFHIQHGEMRAVINGVEQLASAGQTVSVRAGTPHIAGNNKPEPLVCTVEYRPGLDSYRVFQCFAGLTLSGDMDRNGTVNPLKMMYFLKKMRARTLARPAYLPDPVFRLLMQGCLAIGSVAGWEKLYRQFTN